MDLDIRQASIAGVAAWLMMACAPAVYTTPQLVAARQACEDAEDSPARMHAARHLAAARIALSRAEYAHDQDPGSKREARLAERALKKARAAEARGEAQLSRAERSYDR